MSAVDDLVSVMKGGVQNIGQLTLTLQAAFPRINGTFALSAATVTVIAQPSIGANAIVLFSPINGTAALTQSVNGLYVSDHTAGVGFTLSTFAGSAVAGGIFAYIVMNPS